MNNIDINRITKSLYNRLDDLFELTYGSKLDEDDMLYRNVYKFEIEELLEGISSDINIYLSNNLPFGTSEFTNIMLLRWDFFEDNLSQIKQDFEKLCYDIYNSSICIKEKKLKKDDKRIMYVNDKEYDLVKKLIISDMDMIRNTLVKYMIKDENEPLVKLEKGNHDKECSKELKGKIQSIISDYLTDYNNLINIAYKTFNYIPENYDLTFHNKIETFFNLNKNDFLFYNGK